MQLSASRAPKFDILDTGDSSHFDASSGGCVQMPRCRAFQGKE